MFQGFIAYGNDPLYFIVHGICPWFFTILILVYFFSFWRECGYVSINAQLPCIYGGRNTNILDQFWWNFIVNVKMEGIIEGLQCIIMVWTIKIYADNFRC